MNLNAKQRKIILVGIAVIVLMGVYPPWKYWSNMRSYRSESSAGYYLIVRPPRSQYGGYAIDIPRLLTQWAVTVAASGFGVVVTANRKDSQNS